MNYNGNLATVFGAMARVGDKGCPFEQPLHAMRAALSNNPENVDFLRPDALLGIVFVADEDDCSISDPALYDPNPDDPVHGPLSSFRCTRFGVRCSDGGTSPDAMNQIGAKAGCTDSPDSQLLDPVASYRDFLLGLKPGNPERVIVSAIIGPAQPFAVEERLVNNTQQIALAHSCMYEGPQATEVADPAVRLQRFADLFADRSTYAPICERDLSPGLEQIAQLATRVIGTPCIYEPLGDSDPDRPGDQFDCIVEELVGGAATPIMECDEALTPTCWRVIQDAQCPTADNLSLRIERGQAPPPDAVVRMRCRVN